MGLFESGAYERRVASIQALSRMSGYGRMRRKTDKRGPGPRIECRVAYKLLFEICDAYGIVQVIVRPWVIVVYNMLFHRGNAMASLLRL